MTPILTIAIPTYGRYEQIQKQVRIILPQLNQRVALVVYDNHNTTPITELFSQEELSLFTIVRNSVNVGADANIARCFENCTTKWLWTLSDDDWVKEDAVDTILNYIDIKHDYLFTCFLGRENRELLSFVDLCRSLDTLPTFSGAFTMSYCLYNMELLKPYLRFYYENLTSMIGTLILVLKYAEDNQNVKSCFSDIQLIADYDPNVHWNYLKYIRQSQLLMYALDIKNRKFYDKTVFKGYHITNYFLIKIDREGSNVTRLQRISYLFKSIRRQGLFNALRYNPIIVIKLLLKLLFKP